MTPFEFTLLALTMIALLWTKAIDVISTWRLVGFRLAQSLLSGDAS